MTKIERLENRFYIFYTFAHNICMAKKNKQNKAPLSHSNLTDAEKKNALTDPNVFIPRGGKKKKRG